MVVEEKCNTDAFLRIQIQTKFVSNKRSIFVDNHIDGFILDVVNTITDII